MILHVVVLTIPFVLSHAWHTVLYVIDVRFYTARYTPVMPFCRIVDVSSTFRYSHVMRFCKIVDSKIPLSFVSRLSHYSVCLLTCTFHYVCHMPATQFGTLVDLTIPYESLQTCYVILYDCWLDHSIAFCYTPVTRLYRFVEVYVPLRFVTRLARGSVGLLCCRSH